MNKRRWPHMSTAQMIRLMHESNMATPGYRQVDVERFADNTKHDMQIYVNAETRAVIAQSLAPVVL
jgi:hypothetical protein